MILEGCAAPVCRQPITTTNGNGSYFLFACIQVIRLRRRRLASHTVLVLYRARSSERRSQQFAEILCHSRDLVHPSLSYPQRDVNEQIWIEGKIPIVEPL